MAGRTRKNGLAITQYLSHETQFAVTVDVIVVFTIIAIHIAPTKLIQVGIVTRQELGKDGCECFHNLFNILTFQCSTLVWFQ